MLRKCAVLLLCALFGLAACDKPGGPQKTLDELANALKQNDSANFLAQIDMEKFTANHIASMTKNDETLSSLNALGNMLGLGNIDKLIGSVMDLRGKLTQELDRGVASGELVLQCGRSEKPDCPWVPQSLRDATVVELGENAAIAKITTPAKLTSWLSLSKIDGKWLVVGQAVMENEARHYALQGAGMKPAPQQAPAQQAVDI